jgi:hypothetical protein
MTAEMPQPAGRPRRTVAAFFTLSLLLGALALLVAGCGAASTVGGAGSAATATATPRPHTGPQEGGLTVRPCPGPWGSVSGAGTASEVLTPATASHTSQAHLGDLVQVQLPTNMHWAYQSGASSSGSGGSLQMLSPAGLQDAQQDVCVWNFRAVSAGSATLTFQGMPLCDPNQPCTTTAQQLTFTVDVS